MASLAGSITINLTASTCLSKSTDYRSPNSFSLNSPWKRTAKFGSGRRVMHVTRPVRAAPDSISEKVVESIKSAEETCSDDPESGECVAAWDEVEELSAAASHARAKKSSSDPLEEYCADNPETDECRTYD